MWWYTLAVAILWVVNPEIRRVYDLFFGFSKVEIIAILPLLSVTPHIWSLTFGGGWKRLPPLLAYAGWIWIGAFSYALLTAILSENTVAGVYEFVTFVFPIALGLWVAADKAPFDVAYRRMTRILFLLATISSVYGVVQYVVAPVWDVNWLDAVIKTGTTSFGRPFPFQIRVFSTLNDPGSFSLFLAIVLLFVLPELSLRRPLLLLQVPIWCIAFGLTLVRTGWLMFALGTAAYLILSPRRATLLTTFGISAAIIAGILTFLPSAVGNDGMLTSLTNRFATLSNLDEDTSRRERAELYNYAPQIILGAPFGTGLGMLGGSTRLGAAEETTDFDSGYLGRSLEMGIPGLALYLLPQLILLLGGLQLWIRGRNADSGMQQAVAGVAVAVIVAFLFLQFAHDANGFPMLMLWLIECIAVKALVTNREPGLRPAFA